MPPGGRLRAHVRLRSPDGSETELGHGDLVGRLSGAALQLDDPRVSEAHALVSLRGADLKLLALRGRLAVRGKRVAEVVLSPGLVVHVAPDLALEVLDVALPAHAMALEAEGLPRQVLSGVCSLTLHPLSLVPRFRAEADAWLWGEADGWTLESRSGRRRQLEPGQALEVGGVTLRAVRVPIHGAGGVSTHHTVGLAQPLRIVAHYDTVELHPENGPPLLLNGVIARLVSELVLLGGPASWEPLAREVWGDADAQTLRHRLDVTLSRLRSRLRKGGVRSDLVVSDGAGSVELLLGPADVLEDRT